MTTTTNTKVQFTDAAFVRSHSNRPRGFGNWGFQDCTDLRALDRSLVGEVRFFVGSLGDAKRQALAAGMGADTGVVAVLP